MALITLLSFQSDSSTVTIKVNLNGFDTSDSRTEHGFHVHQTGAYLNMRRMHSSRMRTVRYSGRLGGGEGVGVCPGGVSAWGCLPRGVCVSVCLGSICPGGWVCLSGGVCPSMQWGRHHPRPPWTEFLTHACKNITFPQLLRTVISSIVE